MSPEKLGRADVGEREKAEETDRGRRKQSKEVTIATTLDAV